MTQVRRRPALRPLHAELQRAGPGEGQDDRRPTRSSSTSRTPSRPTPRRPRATRWPRPPRAASTAARPSRSAATASTPLGRRRPRRPPPRPGPPPIVVPKVDRRRPPRRGRRWIRPARPTTRSLGDGRDAGGAVRVREIAACPSCRPSSWAPTTWSRSCAPRWSRAAPPILPHLAHGAARRARGRARRSSTASTTT